MLRGLAAMCLCLWIGFSFAQQVDPANAEALYKSGKLLDALPMYEELAKAHPNEMLYQDHLALCRSAEAGHADSPDERKNLALHSQEAARRAVDLGDTSYLIQMMAKRDLNAANTCVPMTPAQALLHEAEKYFSAGDFPSAQAKYAQAAVADPRLYEAPLYAGDTAFRQKDLAAAYRWYARAIAVNPNRETAYRYWGDAILDL